MKLNADIECLCFEKAADVAKYWSRFHKDFAIGKDFLNCVCVCVCIVFASVSHGLKLEWYKEKIIYR